MSFLNRLNYDDNIDRKACQYWENQYLFLLMKLLNRLNYQLKDIHLLFIYCLVLDFLEDSIQLLVVNEKQLLKLKEDSTKIIFVNYSNSLRVLIYQRFNSFRAIIVFLSTMKKIPHLYQKNRTVYTHWVMLIIKVVLAKCSWKLYTNNSIVYVCCLRQIYPHDLHFLYACFNLLNTLQFFLLHEKNENWRRWSINPSVTGFFLNNEKYFFSKILI